MPDSDEDPCPKPGAPRAMWHSTAWLLLAAAGLAIMAYLAAHLPRKPLGLHAVAYAAVGACGLLWLARELHLKPSRRLLAALVGLILAGQVGIAWESHRTFALAVREYWGADPRAGQLAQMRESGSSREVIAAMESHVAHREEVLAGRTSFAAWLRHRLSTVEQFRPDSPWPAVIWLFEVLAGTAAGLWIGWRMGGWAAFIGDGPAMEEQQEPPETKSV